MAEYGKVLWFGGFNRKKEKENDYGFITSRGTSYYVHKSEIVDGATLKEGTWVEFTPKLHKKKGKDTLDAQKVKVIFIHHTLPFENLLKAEEFELAEDILVQAMERQDLKEEVETWFNQWLEYHKNRDPDCSKPYDLLKFDYSNQFSTFVKQIEWKNYASEWGIRFYRKISEFDESKETKKNVQYMNDWVNQQSPEFLIKNWDRLPVWLLVQEAFLQKIIEWFSHLPFNEQMKYKNKIPESLKRRLGLWYLFEGERLNSLFSIYWNSLKDEDLLKEESFQQWLYCFQQNQFGHGWEYPVIGKLEEWAKKRHKLNLSFPKTWRIDTFYMDTNIKLQSLSINSLSTPVRIKLPISKAWKNIPKSFFTILARKSERNEIDIEIPLEAWALFLKDTAPTLKSINWLRKKWNSENQDQRFTLFTLLGENWFSVYQLPPDLGTTEALLFWEDIIDLSKRGFWWNQLDSTGKCLWYIQAFQKGYKNEDFLDSNITDPLLLSFQMLYKRFLGVGQFNNSHWHSTMQDYYIDLAKNGDEKSLKDSTWLWSSCEYDKCTYCEGKPWQEGNETIDKINRAYCPRTKKECGLAVSEQTKGSRFRSYKTLPKHWLHWRMPEIMSFLNIDPPIENKKSFSYVTRFGGWLNRLLELQERLKCRGCHEPMINDFNYSKEFTARYSMTIATCNQHTPGQHDREIYFNDCWNHRDCNKMIDSRDNTQRDMKDQSINPRNGKPRNYYLCTECGAAKDPTYYTGYSYQNNPKECWDFDRLQVHFKKWYYVPGDKCPNCGTEDMKRFTKGYGNEKTHAKCNKCSHTIRIPKVFLPVTELWEQYKKTT